MPAITRLEGDRHSPNPSSAERDLLEYWSWTSAEDLAADLALERVTTIDRDGAEAIIAEICSTNEDFQRFDRLVAKYAAAIDRAYAKRPGFLASVVATERDPARVKERLESDEGSPILL